MEVLSFLFGIYLLGYILNLVMDYFIEEEITLMDLFTAFGSWIRLFLVGMDWLSDNWWDIETKLRCTTIFEKKEK